MLGQIEIFAFDFAPAGFAACQGQLLSIAQNQALFSLIGPRYGGNGVTDFALPKLPRSRPQARSISSASAARSRRRINASDQVACRCSAVTPLTLAVCVPAMTVRKPTF